MLSSKYKRGFSKKREKTSASVLWRHMINGNENEINHKDTKWIDLGLDMDSNMLNIKCALV